MDKTKGIRKPSQMAGIALLILLVLLPQIFPPSVRFFIFLFIIYSIMTLAFNLLLGYSGMLVLGFHGFVGFSGYMLAICVTKLKIPWYLSIPLSAFTCVLLALLLSFLIARMRGLYFAMGTFIAATALLYFFQGWAYVGGGYGMSITAYIDPSILYYIALIIMVASYIVMHMLVRSKIGLRLRAIADDDIVASSLGIDVFRTKLYCWLISSFFIGLASATYYLSPKFISPSSAFDFNWTLIPLTATVIGGMGMLEASFVGAFVVLLIRNLFLVKFPGLSFLIYGFLLIVVLFFFP